MKAFTLNPLLDLRWARFVERHPRASIFHTRGFLEALHRTYGYEPVVYTTASPGEELRNGMVFCKIASWLTGKRLVSLPFSDHCEPFVENHEELEFLTNSVIGEARGEGCKYVEVRPMSIPQKPHGWEGMAESGSFYLHTVDLHQEIEVILRKCHRKSVRGQIKRAGREGLSCREGRSPELVRQFYQLLIVTRRRHHLPPQPREWFENLVKCLDEMLTIRVACKDGCPVASIMTFSFGDRVYYKYGCSEQRFHNLGGVQLLLWQAIQGGKKRGAQVLDLGRSDMKNTGLTDFKDHWGSYRSVLTYYRYPAVREQRRVHRWTRGAAGYAFATLPDSILTKAGKLLYPHIG